MNNTMAANRIRIAFRSDRKEPWCCLRPAILPRHSAWVVGLTRKFQPYSAPLHWRPAEFVFAGTQKWNLLTQVIEVMRPLHQHLDLSWIIARTLRQEILCPGNAVTATLRWAEHTPALSGRNSTILVPRFHPVQQSPTNSPLGPVRSMPKLGPCLLVESGQTLVPAFSFLRLQMMESGKRQGVTELEILRGQAGDRIVRRLRRVEELPAYPPVEINSGVASLRPHPDLVFQSTGLGEPPPVRKRAGSNDGPATTAAPVLNLGAITDEVMRQIDRRLVATRERMGKM